MTKRALIWAAVSTRPQADEEEKFSIPKQIEDGRLMSESQGWQIVDTLVVPGHSRDYRSLDKLAAHARKQNIDAFDRLIEHFERKDFDYFICRDANRFARKASLLHYIAETIIEDCGAIIYDQSNNLFVDEDLLPMWATLQGYKTRAEVKALVTARKSGMIKRAAKGLPTSSHGLIYSHKVERLWDDTGTVVLEEHVIVNPDAARLFQDVAELLLTGMSWGEISRVLEMRGHRRNGNPIHAVTLRDWFMHPTLWGNTAQHFGDDTHSSTKRGFWVFDPADPKPDYVQIYYQTHAPLYTGELAVAIQAELRRRFGLNGKAHPAYVNKFTGLVVCKHCHYAMGYQRVRGWVGLHCVSRHTRFAKDRCTNPGSVPERKLIAKANAVLTILEKSGDWTVLYGQRPEVDQAVVQLERVKSDLAELDERFTDLMKQQPKYKDLMENFEAHLESLNKQKSELKTEQRRLHELTKNAQPKDAQMVALSEFKKQIGKPEDLWNHPDTVINQWLHRILGQWRFVVSRNDVVSLSDEPKFNIDRPKRSRTKA